MPEFPKAAIEYVVEYVSLLAILDQFFQIPDAVSSFYIFQESFFLFFNYSVQRSTKHLDSFFVTGVIHVRSLPALYVVTFS